VPPRFDVYRAVSRRIHAIFADYTPLIEPLSLDEAYLDVSANLRGLPTAWATAKEVRGRTLYREGRAFPRLTAALIFQSSYALRGQ
jgi:DNA polymerase IV